MHDRRTGSIGTVEVDRDAGLEPGDILSPCLSRLEPHVLIHLHRVTSAGLQEIVQLGDRPLYVTAN